MKFLARWTAIVCFISTLTLGWSPFGFAVEDAIIAIVDDELITLKDLKDYAHSTYVGLIARDLPEAQIQEIMESMETEGTNKLIEDKLILSEANKLGLEVREELIDERIEEVEEQYGSAQNLTEALIRSGATLTDLRKMIRDEMKLKYIVDHAVRSRIYVNPQEVTDYYEKNKEQFGRKELVNLESIFIGSTDDPDAASAKANEALKLIEEGGDFTEISEEYSQMPSVGTVERGQLLPLIEEAVFDLEPDETSSLIETDTGIYIFKLTGKSPAEISSLEDVKGTIYDLLFKEKFKTRFMDWLEKLKKNAYIESK